MGPPTRILMDILHVRTVAGTSTARIRSYLMCHVSCLMCLVSKSFAAKKSLGGGGGRNQKGGGGAKKNKQKMAKSLLAPEMAAAV